MKQTLILLSLDVRSLRGFGRYLKGQMLEYSWSCGLGQRVTRAFFELWHEITSVPACFLQVVACRLDNNDSLRLSTKDVEHGLQWWWPCDMRSKDEDPWNCVCFVI